MEPGVMTVREIGHGSDRIETAGIHLTGGRDEDCGRALERTQPLFERSQIDTSDRIVAQYLDHFMADAQHAQRLFRRSMHEAAGHHWYRRQAAHPTLGDVRPV